MQRFSIHHGEGEEKKCKIKPKNPFLGQPMRFLVRGHQSKPRASTEKPKKRRTNPPFPLNQAITTTYNWSPEAKVKIGKMPGNPMDNSRVAVLNSPRSLRLATNDCEANLDGKIGTINFSALAVLNALNFSIFIANYGFALQALLGTTVGEPAAATFWGILLTMSARAGHLVSL